MVCLVAGTTVTETKATTSDHSDWGNSAVLCWDKIKFMAFNVLSFSLFTADG